MIYLLALIPAIGWGAMPLITGKIGGSPVNQMFGIGAGASIVGIIAYLITKPTVSVTAFLVLASDRLFMDNWTGWSVHLV